MADLSMATWTAGDQMRQNQQAQNQDAMANLQKLQGVMTLADLIQKQPLIQAQTQQAMQDLQDNNAMRQLYRDYAAKQSLVGRGTTANGMAGQGGARTQMYNYLTGLAREASDNGFGDRAQGILEQAAKFAPEFSMQKVLTDPNTGKRVVVNYYKDGASEIQPYDPEPEKPMEVSTGQTKRFLDPFTLKDRINPIQMTPTPDAVLSSQTSIREQNLKNAREIERIGQSKAPPGYRYTPNGNLEVIPGGPADVKAQQQAQLKASGATDVDLAISTLRDDYSRLEEKGGITSTQKGAIPNVAAWLSSSALGQVVGKMLGTDNQSARNDIAMTRPALLAALMKATGMSAKQMDSNAELKLWLATATDPTLDVEANRRALDKIEKKYLGGNVVNQQPRTGSPAYQEYLAAFKAANGDQNKIAAINARAKQNGVIQ